MQYLQHPLHLENPVRELGGIFLHPGLQGLGIGEAAYAKAMRYAAERVQMGRPIREHPMIAEMLLDMDTTIVGLRALATEASTLQDLAIRDGLAIGYGILTVENEAQALVRADPEGRDKGGESVRACLAIVELQRRFARSDH